MSGWRADEIYKLMGNCLKHLVRFHSALQARTVRVVKFIAAAESTTHSLRYRTNGRKSVCSRVRLPLMWF